MYRTYFLTEKEQNKITVYRFDGDTGYYDVFENEDERKAEQARLDRIERECQAEMKDYIESLK